MIVEIEIKKLAELLHQAAVSGAKRALEETGAVSGTITSAEVKKMHGNAIYKAARMSAQVNWMPRANGGKKAGVYCRRSDLDKFLFERKFSFNS